MRRMMPGLTPAARRSYIRHMAEGLVQIAHPEEDEMLVYLLQMVIVEATDIVPADAHPVPADND